MTCTNLHFLYTVYSHKLTLCNIALRNSDETTAQSWLLSTKMMACLSRCARLLWKEWDNLWKHLLCMPVRHSEGGKGYVSMCIGEDKLEVILKWFSYIQSYERWKGYKIQQHNNFRTCIVKGRLHQSPNLLRFVGRARKFLS